MKKSIIITCIVIAAISFFGFNYLSQNKSDEKALNIASIEVTTEAKKSDADFIYGIGPRFGPIKKEIIHNDLSITHFLDDMQQDRITSIESIELIVIENDAESNNRIKAKSSEFNEAQINLLKSFNYSDGFKLRIDYKEKHFGSTELFDAYSTPHHTVVPETQAEYIYGKSALINFFVENTKAATAQIPEDKLKPAKLYFTVTKKGSIENVNLDRSSGFPEIDDLMTLLISETPGGWIPASNAKGENVDQELVVSFGLMGC